MKIPEPAKQKAMDVLSSPEIAAQFSALQNPVAAPLPEAANLSHPVGAEIKRQNLSAISNVETQSHMGAMMATGGIALYVAKIREEDRLAGTAPSLVDKETHGREK